MTPEGKAKIVRDLLAAYPEGPEGPEGPPQARQPEVYSRSSVLLAGALRALRGLTIAVVALLEVLDEYVVGSPRPRVGVDHALSFARRERREAENAIAETEDYFSHRDDPTPEEVGCVFIGGVFDGMVVGVDKKLNDMRAPVQPDKLPILSEGDDHSVANVEFNEERYLRVPIRGDQETFYVFCEEGVNPDEMLRRLIGRYPRGTQAHRSEREKTDIFRKGNYGSELQEPNLYGLLTAIRLAKNPKEAGTALLDYVADERVNREWARVKE